MNIYKVEFDGLSDVYAVCAGMADVINTIYYGDTGHIFSGAEYTNITKVNTGDKYVFVEKEGADGYHQV
jgi:hypothetical protein